MEQKKYDPEHQENTTKRKVWWALQYPDGAWEGETADDGGFSLALFATAALADAHAVSLVEDTDYQRAFPVHICIAQVEGRLRS